MVEDGLLITIEDIPNQISLVFAGSLWGGEGKTDGSAFEISGDDANTWKLMGNVQPYDPEDAARYGNINIVLGAAMTDAGL